MNFSNYESNVYETFHQIEESDGSTHKTIELFNRSKSFDSPDFGKRRLICHLCRPILRCNMNSRQSRKSTESTRQTAKFQDEQSIPSTKRAPCTPRLTFCIKIAPTGQSQSTEARTTHRCHQSLSPGEFRSHFMRLTNIRRISWPLTNLPVTTPWANRSLPIARTGRNNSTFKRAWPTPTGLSARIARPWSKK